MRGFLTVVLIIAGIMYGLYWGLMQGNFQTIIDEHHEEYPVMAKLQTLLCWSFYISSQWEFALGAYKKYLEYFPDDNPEQAKTVKFRIADCYQKLDRVDEAAAVYHEIIEVDTGTWRATMSGKRLEMLNK
ncbi:MAG: tetratricopeptide repeat protein [Elusimicrobiota bacterium]